MSTFNSATQQFDVTFTATLANSGKENLSNVNCSDSRGAPLAGVPSNLYVGMTALILGTYSQPGAAATDTITCSAKGTASGSSVTAKADAVCWRSVSPASWVTGWSSPRNG